MNILIAWREYGGAYIATTRLGDGRKVQASSTNSARFAAEAVAKKVLGNYDGDVPRLMAVGHRQYMADAVVLEGFDTVHEGICCKCAAQHRHMFRKNGKKIFCSGCAERDREESKTRLRRAA